MRSCGFNINQASRQREEVQAADESVDESMEKSVTAVRRWSLVTVEIGHC